MKKLAVFIICIARCLRLSAQNQPVDTGSSVRFGLVAMATANAGNANVTNTATMQFANVSNLNAGTFVVSNGISGGGGNYTFNTDGSATAAGGAFAVHNDGSLFIAGAYNVAAAGDVSSASETPANLTVSTALVSSSGKKIVSSATTAAELLAIHGTQTSNTFFAGPPSGTAATPTWRALVAADYPPNLINSNSFDAGTLAQLFAGGGAKTNVANIWTAVQTYTNGLAITNGFGSGFVYPAIGTNVYLQYSNGFAVSGLSTNGILWSSNSTTMTVGGNGFVFNGLGSPTKLFDLQNAGSSVLSVDRFGDLSAGQGSFSGQTTINGQLFLASGTQIQWNFGDTTLRRISAGLVGLTTNLSVLGTVLATNGFTSSVTNTTMFTLTMPASTVNFTNTNSVAWMYFIDNTAVTGTVVKKNGVQINSGLSTDMSIGLRAGETFSETYTIGTPTITGNVYP